MHKQVCCCQRDFIETFQRSNPSSASKYLVTSVTQLLWPLALQDAVLQLLAVLYSVLSLKTRDDVEDAVLNPRDQDVSCFLFESSLSC